MKHICLNACIFIMSLISFIISYQIFYNLAVFADEIGSSPVIMLGGEWANLMDWVRLLFLAIITILSGINIYSDIKQLIQNKNSL